MKKLIWVLGISAFGLPATASAHFNLITPPQSSMDKGGGKGAPPCGPDSARGMATPVQGGHPLTVVINETVQHTGFYRFALAVNSLSELPADNVVWSGPNKTGTILPVTGPGNSGSADFETTPVFPVLADHVFVHVGGTGTLALPSATNPGTVMLPNFNCPTCTLQVIEFMEGHGPNPGGGYFYHHCATLKITADPNLPLFTPPGTGSGGASSGGAGGAAGSNASGGTAGAAMSSGGATTSGGSGETNASGGAGASVDGGNGGAPASAGGAVSSSGGSAGAAPTANAGQTNSSGAGSPATGTDAPGSTDSSGCSFSSRSPGAMPWASLLVGLLLLGRRRRARR